MHAFQPRDEPSDTINVTQKQRASGRVITEEIPTRKIMSVEFSTIAAPVTTEILIKCRRQREKYIPGIAEKQSNDMRKRERRVSQGVNTNPREFPEDLTRLRLRFRTSPSHLAGKIGRSCGIARDREKQ